MKINKLFLGIFSLLALTLTGCKDGGDDSYDWATVTGNQVYFSNDLAKTQTVSVSSNSINIPIRRAKADDAIQVPLTVSKESGSIYNVPSSVSFDVNSKESYITITYDPSKVVYGKYENLTISIGDENYTTPYGFSSYSFQIGATEWVSFGVGLYREDLLSCWFAVENLVYEVEIEKNIVQEGYYRMVNPYGESYPYNDPPDYDGDALSYMTINATDPDHVYVELSPTTMDWGYGIFSMQSIVSYYLNKGNSLEELIAGSPEYFGTLKDGVITMPAGSMLISMSDYNSGNWTITNNNGLFAVAFPGAVFADYSIDMAYLGRFTDSKDVDYAQMQLILGEDVAEAKYAWVTDENMEIIYNDIVNGGDYPSITESGEIRLPYEATGTYTLLVVIFNSDGDAVGYETFEVKLKSSKDNAPSWTDLYLGVMTYNQMWINDPSDDLPSDEAVLSKSDSEPDTYRILPYFMNEDEGLVFHWDRENNVITFDEVATGYVHPSYGMIYVCDGPSYNPDRFPFEECPSYYDSENYVFHFAPVHYVEAGSFGYKGQETFELTGNAAKATKNVRKKGRNTQVKINSKLLPFNKEISLKKVKKSRTL